MNFLELGFSLGTALAGPVAESAGVVVGFISHYVPAVHAHLTGLAFGHYAVSSLTSTVNFFSYASTSSVNVPP